MARTRGTIVRAFTAPHAVYGYALAYGPDGEAYVICDEGVGWLVTEDRPLIVDTFGGNGGMYGEYAMPLAEVKHRAEQGTDIDLADHIRTFGSRLDSNHYMWVARLTGK